MGASDARTGENVGRDSIDRRRLVFTADDDGDLVAVDARTGQDLWHFHLGSNLKASPMTFAVDGKQYITIAAGTNIFTFGLLDR